ncbi:ABC-three component system protein [Zunongwangia sp.]|uniref:ABC-three component system protein n=1 Tax=Zunongwangia sp. TaxID=1965325 RepID=UPI003AA8C282
MLEIIHKNSESKNLIIFVHGFMGNRGTWIKGDGSMPFIDKLLVDNEIKSNFDIGLFNYYSKLLEFNRSPRIFKRLLSKKKVLKNSPIEDISSIFQTSLKYHCETYQNIVLIGHSMGGLIGKKVILDQISLNGKSIIDLYISLATPHSGSDLANLGKSFFGNKQIKHMTPLDGSITKINNDWIQSNSLPRRFYAVGTSDDIVPKSSAIALDREKQNTIFSDHDHFSIIKPTNESDNVLLAVKSEIKKFFKEKETSKDQNSAKFCDEGQYDQEIFVLKLIIADVHETLISASKEAFFSAEFAIRRLHAMGVDINELSALYAKIKEIYSIEFGNLLSGNHLDSNALVTSVHKEILNSDQKYLKTLYEPLEGLQKYGMLQQLAIKDDTIWWARNNNISTLEEFKDKIATANG